MEECNCEWVSRRTKAPHAHRPDLDCPDVAEPAPDLLATMSRLPRGVTNTAVPNRIMDQLASEVVLLRAHLGRTEVQRQIKSEGGRTWRRTIRVQATDWVADEEEK